MRQGLRGFAGVPPRDFFGGNHDTPRLDSAHGFYNSILAIRESLALWVKVINTASRTKANADDNNGFIYTRRQRHIFLSLRNNRAFIPVVFGRGECLLTIVTGSDTFVCISHFVSE